MKVIRIILLMLIFCLQFVITDAKKEDAKFGAIVLTNTFLLFYLGLQATVMG